VELHRRIQPEVVCLQRRLTRRTAPGRSASVPWTGRAPRHAPLRLCPNGKSRGSARSVLGARTNAGPCTNRNSGGPGLCPTAHRHLESRRPDPRRAGPDTGRTPAEVRRPGGGAGVTGPGARRVSAGPARLRTAPGRLARPGHRRGDRRPRGREPCPRRVRRRRRRRLQRCPGRPGGVHPRPRPTGGPQDEHRLPRRPLQPVRRRAVHDRHHRAGRMGHAHHRRRPRPVDAARRLRPGQGGERRGLHGRPLRRPGAPGGRRSRAAGRDREPGVVVAALPTRRTVRARQGLSRG